MGPSTSRKLKLPDCTPHREGLTESNKKPMKLSLCNTGIDIAIKCEGKEKHKARPANTVKSYCKTPAGCPRKPHNNPPAPAPSPGRGF